MHACTSVVGSGRRACACFSRTLPTCAHWPLLSLAPPCDAAVVLMLFSNFYVSKSERAAPEAADSLCTFLAPHHSEWESLPEPTLSCTFEPSPACFWRVGARIAHAMPCKQTREERPPKPRPLRCAALHCAALRCRHHPRLPALGCIPLPPLLWLHGPGNKRLQASPARLLHCRSLSTQLMAGMQSMAGMQPACSPLF